jgi:hypothetical protein
LEIEIRRGERMTIELGMSTFGETTDLERTLESMFFLV